MPNTILNFLGIGYPGVNCNCAPPDTNGAIGATQYIQIVNESYQVFNKSPETLVGFPGGGQHTTYHFHVDFVTPANSTWSVFATPAFTQLCPSTRACVPQAGVTSTNYLDALGDRLMFRLPYRNFGDHESIVENYSVSTGGVSGVRWFELRNVTSGPVTVYQEEHLSTRLDLALAGRRRDGWRGESCDRL